MSHMRIASGISTALVAATFTLSSGAVLAQTSSGHTNDAGVVINSTAAHYRLTNQNNVESLDYDQARELRVCNMTGKLAPASGSSNTSGRLKDIPLTNRPVPLDTKPQPIDLKLQYGGQAHQLSPGECDRFRAKDVRLTAAQLPAGSALDVSVEQVGANGSQRTAQTGGESSSNAATAASPKELANQLKEQDKTMRQANKELKQSQTRLAEATRKLKHTESAERRTTHAEHQAAAGERQEGNAVQQNAPQSESHGTQQGSSGPAANGQQGTPE